MLNKPIKSTWIKTTHNIINTKARRKQIGIFLYIFVVLCENEA
jgi:hypothetical protein